MANSTWRSWSASIGQSIAATALLSLVPGGVVTWLAHIQSIWTLPALAGLGAMLLASGSVVAIRAANNLPAKRVLPGPENIESCVRLWLDNYRVSVKSDPWVDAYFRLRITLDGGSHLTVIRSKVEYSDYVQIVADMGIRGEDRKLVKLFSEDEIAQILLDIKVELARAKMGYGGLVDPPETFHLFRRVPIHHNLTEFAFMSMVGDVEAAMNLVGLMFLKAKRQADKKQIDTLPATPLLTSDAPTSG